MKSNSKTNKQLFHKPKTRRDFIAAGLIEGPAYALLPSTLLMASAKVMGAVDPTKCAPSGAAPLRGPAFLAIDCVGGMNLLGANFMVGIKGQMDFLPAGSYTTLGVPSAIEPRTVAPDTTYGVAIHANSTILTGLNQVITDPAMRAKINGVVACAQTDDDTRQNPLNVNQMIAKIAPPPGLVANVGVVSSASGGNHSLVPITANPAYAPTIVKTPADALGLVDPGVFTAKEAETIIAEAGKMSDSQLAVFQSKSIPDQIKDLMNCGYLSGSSFLSRFTPTALDANLDTRLTPIFPALATDAKQQRLATITKLLIDGNATCGTYVIGGCDYHGQGVAAASAIHLEVGQAIGRFFRSCAVANVRGMVFLTTDGGVSSGAGGVDAAVGPFSAYTSDSGQRSGAVILVYDPTARLPSAIAGNQIGSYTAAGAADTGSSPLAGSPTNLGLWAVASYAGLLGKADQMATFLGGTNPIASLKDSGAAFGNIKT